MPVQDLRRPLDRARDEPFGDDGVSGERESEGETWGEACQPDEGVSALSDAGGPQRIDDL